MIASLPMYDWPEVRQATDALWSCLRDAIRERDIETPEKLDRSSLNGEVWTDPTLVLSQTCGMPWRLGLHTQAQLIGTPDYRVEGCPPGYYCSVIVVRTEDVRTNLSEFAQATCAFNSRDSQSGFAAWEGMQFGALLETGAHAASIAAVASRKADIAAIDAVTWRLARQFQPEAAHLRVLEKTKPTPGLPFITARGQNASPLFEAASEGIAALDKTTRETLGIQGLVHIPDEAYRAVG
jgi:ABC-type phosphate/phosphonate transport system substrate-binding protein